MLTSELMHGDVLQHLGYGNLFQLISFLFFSFTWASQDDGDLEDEA